MCLQAAGLIQKGLGPKSVDFKYWKHECSDLTDEHLRRGREKIPGFTGYLVLGEWIKMCSEDPKASNAPCHKPFAPRLEQKKASEETRAKHIAELRELFRA